jgi:hypothetical protein
LFRTACARFFSQKNKSPLCFISKTITTLNHNECLFKVFEVFCKYMNIIFFPI